MEYYLALKKNMLQVHTTAWMTLVNVIMSKKTPDTMTV